MKTAFPSLRVEPELPKSADRVLQDGESLLSFVEQSIRESISEDRRNANSLRAVCVHVRTRAAPVGT